MSDLTDRLRTNAEMMDAFTVDAGSPTSPGDTDREAADLIDAIDAAAEVMMASPVPETALAGAYFRRLIHPEDDR